MRECVCVLTCTLTCAEIAVRDSASVKRPNSRKELGHCSGLSQRAVSVILLLLCQCRHIHCVRTISRLLSLS